MTEVNKYGGVGTEDNHVNKNTYRSKGTANDISGYGAMAYYSGSGCGGYSCNCITDYEESDIKYVVDAWSLDNVPNGLVESRLIKNDELIENLGYNEKECTTSCKYNKGENTPSWIYNSAYKYWTMSSDNSSSVYSIDSYGGSSDSACACFYEIVVRPVIVLSKSAL